MSSRLEMIDDIFMIYIRYHIDLVHYDYILVSQVLGLDIFECW